MARVLDGRKIASGIRDEVTTQAATLRDQGTVPALAVVVATADQAAASYVRAIRRIGERAGIDVSVSDMGAAASAPQLADELGRLALDQGVHGIILQTPLPPRVRGDGLAEIIPGEKDVDGASPLSAGRLLLGQAAYAPATALAVVEALRAHDVPIAGQHAVVVGRSAVVGKPAAVLLLARDATVTICHSRTRDLAALTRQADILVAAIGRPSFFGSRHVKPGAVVIDVGTTVGAGGEVAGDVDREAIEDLADAVTPVPGGIGPITTAILLRNTIRAASGLTPST